MIPAPSLLICEQHLTVFIGGDKEQSLSLRPRIRFVPVGSAEGASAQDKAAQILDMEKGLPDTLSQILSLSPSADGFLRRPSLSFVDVSMSSW